MTKIPRNLKHKPIIVIDDYDKIDGKFRKDTDVKFLSIGRATYNNNHISTKVWRYNNNANKWKRQSDDLPLHRVFDLSILILGSMLYDENSDYSKTRLNEMVIDKEELPYLIKYLKDNEELLKDRISTLTELTKQFTKKIK
jgi:hypothetical protein